MRGVTETEGVMIEMIERGIVVTIREETTKMEEVGGTVIEVKKRVQGLLVEVGPLDRGRNRRVDVEDQDLVAVREQERVVGIFQPEIDQAELKVPKGALHPSVLVGNLLKRWMLGKLTKQAGKCRILLRVY